VELLDGKVIDGRRRLRACEIAGVTPQTKAVSVSDPVAYVLSLNLHRRHLTPSQLSMVAARTRSYYEEQAKQRQVRKPADSVVENLPQQTADNARARDAAGKAVGVSGKSVDYATRVLQKGVSELVSAVDEGRIAVSTAAIIANDPPDAQRDAASRANRKYRPTKDGSEFGATATPLPEPDPVSDSKTESRGVGVRRGHEAVDCLKRIPKIDPLRLRGFQIVSDWIKQNR
jgi:hypothetical protein